MKTGNTQSPSRQPATTPGGPGRLSKYIVAGILTALVLAVFVTSGLQAPPTAEAQTNNTATGVPGVRDAANPNGRPAHSASGYDPHNVDTDSASWTTTE